MSLVDERIFMASIDNGKSYIPIENISTINLIETAENALQDISLKDFSAWSCSIDLSENSSFTNRDKEFIRVKIFGLPANPLKKKKLNKKTYVKALMAQGVSRNDAESSRSFYKIGKGLFSYPRKGDEIWNWLWR